MTRLITEADLRRLAPGARVAVGAGTLVTPAARDYALVAGIVLDDSARERGRGASCCAACAGGGPCACGAKLPPLADGDWLVEVRGGVARARRIER